MIGVMRMLINILMIVFMISDDKVGDCNDNQMITDDNQMINYDHQMLSDNKEDGMIFLLSQRQQKGKVLNTCYWRI